MLPLLLGSAIGGLVAALPPELAVPRRIRRAFAEAAYRVADLDSGEVAKEVCGQHSGVDLFGEPVLDRCLCRPHAAAEGVVVLAAVVLADRFSDLVVGQQLARRLATVLRCAGSAVRARWLAAAPTAGSAHCQCSGKHKAVREPPHDHGRIPVAGDRSRVAR